MCLCAVSACDIVSDGRIQCVPTKRRRPNKFNNKKRTILFGLFLLLIENGESSSQVEELEVRSSYDGFGSGSGMGGTRGFTVLLRSSWDQRAGKCKGHYGGMSQRRAGKLIKPGSSLTSDSAAAAVTKKKPTALSITP